MPQDTAASSSLPRDNQPASEQQHPHSQQQQMIWQSETEKYANPIAGREVILELLAKHNKPISREELQQALHISAEEQQEALRRRLRAMERDGQLVFTRRQCYVLPEKLDLVKGTVIGHRDGYGFLRQEGSKNDLFLPIEQMRNCMHGDVVLAQALGMDRRGRREARIVRVLAEKSGQFVGRYFTDAGIGFVVPDDSRFSFDILIPPQDIHGARMGFMVVVELTQRPSRRCKAVGKIVEVLGDNMGTGMAVDIALRKHDIPYLWSDQVKQQLATLHEQVPESAKAGRRDLRHLPLVTIDGEDARDFDDAVYCEKKRGGGWRLWVAIADVSYYVRPQTALDNEAYQRGNSVYFPSQVVPMLPEVLSNGLCSLNPQVDRLCLVCEMTISAKGRISSFVFYDGLINSHARLTYNKVWHILQGDAELCQHYQPLLAALQELHSLYQVLDSARQERGGIGFESEEAKFIFNAERRIERIEVTERNDAHKMIEESMILANICAARLVERHQQAALFRVHDRPGSDALLAFRSVLGELGLQLGGGDKPQPKDYAHLLQVITGRPDQQMLQTMLLRSMKQAIYDPENRGHFGLALTCYAHFTSPIRRYPDLLLHRAIKYLLTQQRLAGDTGGWHYSSEQMLQAGEHCSMTERRADEATREVADWLKCDFMQDHVGDIFSGVITSVSAFGFFVRLDDLFIDGLVHVSNLENDYYRFDATGQRLVGQASGQTWRLGDHVQVRVLSVNMDERKIDFGLVASQRMPRRAGKTEREKRGKSKKSSSKRLSHGQTDALTSSCSRNSQDFAEEQLKGARGGKKRQTVHTAKTTNKAKTVQNATTESSTTQKKLKTRTRSTTEKNTTTVQTSPAANSTPVASNKTKKQQQITSGKQTARSNNQRPAVTKKRRAATRANQTIRQDDQQ